MLVFTDLVIQNLLLFYTHLSLLSVIKWQGLFCNVSNVSKVCNFSNVSNVRSVSKVSKVSYLVIYMT